MRRFLLMALFSVFGGLTSGVANAGEMAAMGTPAGKGVQLSDDADVDLWDVDLRIDGWGLQLSIEVTDNAIPLSDSIFIGLDDILENVDWIVPFGADIRYRDRFGFLPDIVAAKLTGNVGSTRFFPFSRRSTNLKLAALNLAAYYRVIDRPHFKLDAVAGARLLWVDLGVGYSGGLIGNVQVDVEEYIWDAIGGLRIQGDLNEKFFYSIYGDAGSGDSKLTWQVWANLGYRFKENFSASLGYRYLTWDEAAGEDVIDLTASGPIVVLTWHF